MRRVLFIASLMMSLMLMPALTASAGVPEYLNDRVLILSGMHGGTAWYIDKSSIVIEKESPPVYEISFQLFRAQYDMNVGDIVRVFNQTVERYMYNTKEHEMYHWREDDSTWHYVAPVGSRTDTGSEFSGEMAFYLAYKQAFYGGRRWRDRHTGELRDTPFGSELYDRIDNAY